MPNSQTSDSNPAVASLSREAFLNRKPSQKLERCRLLDGSTVLMRRPTGKEHREWRRLLRNEDGSLNVDRHSMNEELLLTFIIVDDSGEPFLTVEDVMVNHVFDRYELGDLNAMKEMADSFSSNRSLEDRGKN